jgi:hypothetical protein
LLLLSALARGFESSKSVRSAVQGVAAAVATTVTLPYGALVGLLLYLDLRARKERLDLDTIKANLQASTA